MDFASYSNHFICLVQLETRLVGPRQLFRFLKHVIIKDTVVGRRLLLSVSCRICCTTRMLILDEASKWNPIYERVTRLSHETILDICQLPVFLNHFTILISGFSRYYLLSQYGLMNLDLSPKGEGFFAEMLVLDC